MSKQFKGRGLLQITGRQPGASTIMSQTMFNNPITLTGAQGASVNTINLSSSHSSWEADFLHTPSHTHHDIKKFEMYETPVDVLTLSCTLQRIREEKKYGHKILDKTVVESVTAQDREKCAAIRDYYSKKIMFGKLNEKLAMTKFREDMNRFIHTDGLHFKESDLGMVCYLPTFYDYDIQLDEVKAVVDTNQGFREMDKKGTPRSLGVTVNLKPLKKLVRKTRNREIYQYWMSDDKLNAAVMLQIGKDNALMHIWDHLFNTSKVLQISGSYGRNFNDDFEYFHATNWKLQMD